MTPGVDLSNIPEKCYFLLLRSFPTQKKRDNICFVREKKMADCVPLEEEMLEALCWLCTTTTWNNYLDGLGLPFSFYQSFDCYLPIVSFYSVCVCSGLLKFILVFLVFFFTGECCCPATNSYRYDDLIQSVVGGTHTIFSSVFRECVCVTASEGKFWFSSAGLGERRECVCACVLLFLPLQKASLWCAVLGYADGYRIPGWCTVSCCFWLLQILICACGWMERGGKADWRRWFSSCPWEIEQVSSSFFRRPTWLSLPSPHVVYYLCVWIG